jgi:hypothetical protein
MWKVVTTREFDSWLDAAGHDVVSEVVAIVTLLSEFGPRLGRPHVDTLKGSKYAHMKELRVRTADAQIRIAFAFDPDRQAILLVAGDKRGVNEKRFYRQLIAKAEALYEAHLKKR